MPIVIPHVDEYDAEKGVTAAALAYAKAGLYIAPTVNRGESPGKNPGTALGRHWQTATVTGSADAYALFGEEHPDAVGIALHCGRSGVLAIDVDTEDESLIPEPIKRAIEECRPPTFTTRRGAVLRAHYIFEQPPGRMIGNAGGKLGSGWGDIRGKNGVIILPGSWHPKESEGGAYVMRQGGEVPVLPAYVADLLTDQGAAGDAATGLEVSAFLAEHVSSMRPDMIGLGPVKAFTEAVDAGQGRHTSMIDAACWAMREARAGLYPARDAAAALGKALSAAVGGERSTTGEMMGILAWAIGQANATDDARLTQIRENAMPRTPAPPAVDEESGRSIVAGAQVTLPSPGAPVKVARALDELSPAVDGVRCARWWQGSFYRWNGAHWAPWADAAVEGWIYRQTEHAQYLAPPKDADPEDELTPDAEPVFKPWTPNTRKVREVSNALAKLVWTHEGDAESATVCANGAVDLLTGELRPATPRTFNLWSLPFDYDPAATCPRWLRFLEEALPGQEDAWAFLGEWFGYVLSGRTDQQKIASLIGKRRGGKGTTLWVLQQLLNEAAVAAPDITDLGSHFGRASLVGKSLAVMSDVRWNSALSSEALKTLLMVSGEDVVSFPRKHMDDWTGRCGARFMAASNDVPHFADRSNAIGARMIHVKFEVTFEGREDFTLKDKLRAELPGILNWARAGLARLNEQGRFTVPASGLEISRDMEEAANPVAVFVVERCEPSDVGEWVNATELLEAYDSWRRERRMKEMSMYTFLAALRQAGPFVAKRRSNNGRKVQQVSGVRVGDGGWPPLRLVR